MDCLRNNVSLSVLLLGAAVAFWVGVST